jgi:hypothetical protein
VTEERKVKKRLTRDGDAEEPRKEETDKGR